VKSVSLDKELRQKESELLEREVQKTNVELVSSCVGKYDDFIVSFVTTYMVFSTFLRESELGCTIVISELGCDI